MVKRKVFMVIVALTVSVVAISADRHVSPQDTSHPSNVWNESIIICSDSEEQGYVLSCLDECPLPFLVWFFGKEHEE